MQVMKERVAVGISGGVDSMVCAKMLIEEGYDVFGATMYHYDEMVDGVMRPPQFIENAKLVCEQLNIEHLLVDLREAFDQQVVAPFIDAYLRGETPNPCAMCNPTIKYGAFLDVVMAHGATYLATGHYATVAYDEHLDKYRIYQGKDPRKDQSFLLYSLSQAQLSKLILPLGDVEKKALVREEARSIHEALANQKDSTDICFIPKGKYYDFIKIKRPGSVQPGNFVTVAGEVLGQHKGIINYTIGQRRGLLVTLNRPMFVVDIRPESNEVVLGDDAQTYSVGFEGEAFNFTIYDELPLNRPLKVKVCQWGYYLDCKIIQDDGYKVLFEKPERAIAKGQVAVFYQEREVVGGCRIRERVSK